MKNTKPKKVAKEKLPSVEKLDITTAAQVTGQVVPEKAVDMYSYMRDRNFPYKEKEFKDYQKALASMTFSTLQKHALEIANIVPNILDPRKLIKKLEEIYLQKQGKYLIAYRNSTAASTGLTGDAAKSAQAILNSRN